MFDRIINLYRTSKCFKNTVILLMVVLVVYTISKFVYGSDRNSDDFPDYFMNVDLNDVQMPNYTPLPADLQRAIAEYNCYFNDNTNKDLADGAILAKENITSNYPKIQANLINLNTQVNNKLQELNYNLLTQIQKNYYDAHILNVQRENSKLRLDELPLRNI